MKRSIATSLLLSLLGVSAILALSTPIAQHDPAPPTGLAEVSSVGPDLGPVRDARGAHLLPAITVTAFVGREAPVALDGDAALEVAAGRVRDAIAAPVGAGVGRVGHAMPYYAFGGAARPGKE